MNTAHSLNQMVASVPQATIHEMVPGYPVVRIANQFGSAEIALHGAHLIGFTPWGGTPVIFLSRQAVFQPGVPIRGGIPVCWPWFSRHRSHADFPSHGIARTGFWSLQEVCQEIDYTRVVMSLDTDGNDPRWPFLSSASICFTVGKSLGVALTTHNRDRIPFQFSDALHCYFRLGESEVSQLLGLDGCRYVFRLEDKVAKTQVESIQIDQPIDRIFQSTEPTFIVDPVNHRTIVVNKSGSGNTIVWNPGRDGAKTMADLGDDEYRQFVCVEPGNVYPLPIILEPSESHVTATTISVQPLPK